ncbi:MAG: RsmB/NOP family class I SAM-dependent RNA methyltransferase [Actinomycetota bacterium]
MIRDLAFELLKRVEAEDAYANLLLPKLLERSGLDSRDSSFVQELAFGTIRNKLLYDRIIELASGRKIPEIDPNALILLRIGAHQILQMRVPDHAAINETVNLAKKVAGSGAVGFVNAVLRKILRNDLEQWKAEVSAGERDDTSALGLIYSHPIWVVQALKAALASRGKEAELQSLLEINNLPAKVSVCALPGHFDPTNLQSIGAERGPASPIGGEIEGNPSAIAEIRQGIVRVQDQGSQLAALALTSAPILCQESGWLDMCAGPGGKAALLVALAKKLDVNVLCNEVLPKRAELVRRALEPLGTNFEITIMDGKNLPQLGKTFSRILIDAPCTGLGALRRRPEARYRKQPADLADLTKLQRDLITSGWEMLAPGGVLAYVTCSPHLSETTAQVAWAKAKFEGKAEILNANSLLNSISPSLGLDESVKTAQLWPHQHSTDAMFIALLRKSVG